MTAISTSGEGVRRMAKRRPKRRGRSRLSTFFMVTALAAAGFFQLYRWAALAPGDKARIFAAYAELGLSPKTIARMRPSPPPPAAKPERASWRTVTRVIDGDSLELDGGVKVRLLGIDTPESAENNALYQDLGRMGGVADKYELMALGKEASGYAVSRALGKRCWLEYEGGEEDMYGRVLAYVHLEDGSILNEEMLHQGYAKVYLSSNFKYKQRYIRLQMAAMARRNGFWAGDAEAESDIPLRSQSGMASGN